MTDNLLPCPFCEGNNVDCWNVGWWAVLCDDCDARGPAAQRQEAAIAAWNRRAQPDTQQLINVLDVAIARGEALGYEDDDYHEMYKRLTGKEWSDD